MSQQIESIEGSAVPKAHSFLRARRRVPTRSKHLELAGIPGSWNQLLFQADGRVPGDDIQLRAAGGTVEARVEATSYVPFHRLEVVYNGRIVASREDNAGTRQMTLAEKVSVPGPGWLAARCFSKLGLSVVGLAIAAHTSPVYLRVPGQDLFSAPAITYMLTLIEGTETYIRKLATRPDQERLARILKVYADAREHLHQRLHAHGIKHPA